jgi:Chain length determinant protein
MGDPVRSRAAQRRESLEGACSVKNPLSRVTETRASTLVRPEADRAPSPPPPPEDPLDPREEPAEGIFEPPGNFVLEAIRFHKLLVAAIAVAGALLGVGLGLARQPVYTASATLQVGEVNPNSPGFGSYTQSATSLAAGFSRSIVAAPVLARIDRTLGLAPQQAASRLSAEPIPLSPVFRVIATGSSETAARRLANVTAGAVVTYVTKANSASPAAGSLLGAYRHAALEVRKAKARQAALGGSESEPTQKQLAAEAALSTAQVKLEAISRSYITAVISEAPRSGLVSVLAGAATASSDRRSKLELYAFIGLLAGFLLGCGAAVWRERGLPVDPRGGLVPRPR